MNYDRSYDRPFCKMFNVYMNYIFVRYGNEKEHFGQTAYQGTCNRNQRKHGYAACYCFRCR